MILMDTQIVLWLALEPQRLSKNARSAIVEARSNGEGLAICDITLLEIAHLVGKGRIKVMVGIESFLQEIEEQFIVLPISGRACARLLTLPADYPKDPADRVIGATALVEGIPLVTSDVAIRRSKALPTIW